LGEQAADPRVFQCRGRRASQRNVDWGNAGVDELGGDRAGVTVFEYPLDQFAPGVASLVGEVRHQSSSSELTRIASEGVVRPASTSCTTWWRMLRPAMC